MGSKRKNGLIELFVGMLKSNDVDITADKTSTPPKPPDPFRLDRPLYNFTPGDDFTTRDAVEGAAIVGRTGSGKSSGPGRALSLSYLRAMMGGLVVCHSREELAEWQRRAQLAGRADDLVVIVAGGPNRLNVLEHAGKHAASAAELPELVADIIGELGELTEPGKLTYDNNPFFRNAMNGGRIKPAVQLLQLAEEPITIDNISRIIAEAPTSTAEAEDPSWRSSSFTFQLLNRAFENTKSSAHVHRFTQVKNHWLTTYPREHYETRENVNSTLNACIHTLVGEPLRTLFATDTTIDLADAFNGKVFVICLPVQVHNKAGRCGSVLFRGAFHRTVKNRDIEANKRPVFLWIDEAQEFVTSQDAYFQASARHARCATVMLFQCKEGLRAAFGPHGNDAAEALIQHLTTKIVCACEGETVEWVANKLVGHRHNWRTTVNQQTGQIGTGTSMGASIDPQITASELTRLKPGGPRSNSMVEALLFKSGRTWSNGDNHLIVIFDQNVRL